ncbi:DNA-deoxyinosine glycosylase [Herbaspirillum sp. LeCh32-8]|uniref:DNA-deoxyinosine glycosylase n=1 Tax=Herbaspirillum sp. LeCh32-8 TaxID=2821356 RepID=UPI001AE98C3F|nr:DNA-deoxyinosine glycosylase [Herbaspirillum sp. LeCh32-8]MBP0596698.1 DNA-deoxyinosine glycosylase [Herbaspirillum sp. LeCh32-8]
MPARKPLQFTAADPLLASFPPVVAADTRTLILGSLPGAASLAASQYYGHPRNGFWKLLSEITGEALVAMAYEDRLQTLLAHRIGLWDVIANARRIGSLDSDIRDHSHNDLLTLLQTLPDLQTIAFNGGTAARIGLKALGESARRYRILSLPSSSPAHASLSYEQKLGIWRQLASSDVSSA